MKLSPDQISVTKTYIEVLPDVMRDRYGGTGYEGYTAGQIRAAIEAADLPGEHVTLAIVLFGDDEAASGTGLRTIGRDQVIGEIRESYESEPLKFADRVLERFIRFLKKAGDISDGAGSD